MMLHTQCIKALGLVVSEEDFFMFSLYVYAKYVNPGAGSDFLATAL